MHGRVEREPRESFTAPPPGGWSSPRSNKASLPTSSTRSSLSVSGMTQAAGGESHRDRPGPSRPSNAGGLPREKERERYGEKHQPFVRDVDHGEGGGKGGARERERERDNERALEIKLREREREREAERRGSGGNDSSTSHPAASQQQHPSQNHRRGSISSPTGSTHQSQKGGRSGTPMDES